MQKTTEESRQQLKKVTSAMATFIATIKFTQKGLDEITESTKRAAAFKAAAKKMGVKVTGNYWTTGYFDGVLIFEAPDDETAAAATMHLSGQGYVHTTTARAFEAGEMGKVIGMLKK
jgi:uncharacterized protein with GYD domain